MVTTAGCICCIGGGAARGCGGAAKKGAGVNVAGGIAHGEAAGSGAAAMAAGMGCITPKLKRLRGTAGPGEGWAKEAMTGATGTGGGGC